MNTNNAQPKNAANIATAIGFIAILLWATLALFTSLTKGIPPFQLLLLSFFIGATVNALWLGATKQLSRAAFVVPIRAWLLSVSFIICFTLTRCRVHPRWKRG